VATQRALRVPPSRSSQRHPASSQRHPASSQRHPASSQRHPASSQRHPASSWRHPASSQRHRASSQRHPASSQRHPASSQRHPASSQRHPASSQRHPASSQRHPARLTRRSRRRRPRRTATRPRPRPAPPPPASARPPPAAPPPPQRPARRWSTRRPAWGAPAPTRAPPPSAYVCLDRFTIHAQGGKEVSRRARRAGELFSRRGQRRKASRLSDVEAEPKLQDRVRHQAHDQHRGPRRLEGKAVAEKGRRHPRVFRVGARLGAVLSGVGRRRHGDGRRDGGGLRLCDSLHGRRSHRLTATPFPP
jgi:hypothetical protein